MNLKDPSPILWETIQRMMTIKSESRSVPWKFREGLELLIDPSARCPDCEEWIPTNRVWLLDNNKTYLLKCWDLKGNVIWWKMSGDPDELIVHPHVKYTGEICAGNTGSAANALFACLDKGTHYHNTEKWFWQWGHDCPQVEKVNCAICSKRDIASTLTLYGGVRICNEGIHDACINFAYDFRCRICFAETGLYDNINITDNLCEHCYLEKTTLCGFCPNRMWSHNIRRTTEEIPLCIACRPNHSVPCHVCEVVWAHSDLNSTLTCPECVRHARNEGDYCQCNECRRARGDVQCEACEGWFDPDDLFENLCEECGIGDPE